MTGREFCRDYALKEPIWTPDGRETQGFIYFRWSELRVRDGAVFNNESQALEPMSPTSRTPAEIAKILATIVPRHVVRFEVPSDENTQALFSRMNRDDVSVASADGTAHFRFSRDAPSYAEAYASALKDMERAGFLVVSRKDHMDIALKIAEALEETFSVGDFGYEEFAYVPVEEIAAVIREVLRAESGVRASALREAVMAAHRMPDIATRFNSNQEADAYCAGRHEARDAVSALLAVSRKE